MSEQARDWAMAHVKAGTLGDLERRALLWLADHHMPERPVNAGLAEMAGGLNMAANIVWMALWRLHHADMIGSVGGMSAHMQITLKLNHLPQGVASAHEHAEGAV